MNKLLTFVCWLFLAGVASAQSYPQELPPQIDPVRIFEIMSATHFDEPRDESEITDILVVWSQTVNFSPALAQQAVDASNVDYARSGIRGRLRLVGAQRVSFNESSGSGLSWMTSGGYAELTALRDAAGADIVHMVTNDNACGVGYLNASASYPFSTSHVSCTIGNRTFQHEIGHNQGAHHDPGQGGAPNCGAAGITAYNCGHAFAEGRTNMAYNGGPRIGYFSTPLVLHNGSPVGTVSRDNARVINANFARVSGFRPTKQGKTAPTNHPR